jgi:hypothetical protein
MHLTYRDSKRHTSVVSGASAPEAGAPEKNILDDLPAGTDLGIFWEVSDLICRFELDSIPETGPELAVLIFKVLAKRKAVNST